MTRNSDGNAQGLHSSSTSHDRILRAAKKLFARSGYANTSTASIARAAGTSESQLIKHFGSKCGLLEAVFDQGWQRINQETRKAVGNLFPTSRKLDVLAGVMLDAMEQDPDLKQLMLLEGRRVRNEGGILSLSKGFLEFVQLLDELLLEMRDAGELRTDLPLHGIRSALIGMFEGLMRDLYLSEHMGYPAHFTLDGIRKVFGALTSLLTRPSLAPSLTRTGSSFAND